MNFQEYLRKCAKNSRVVAFLGTSKNIYENVLKTTGCCISRNFQEYLRKCAKNSRVVAFLGTSKNIYENVLKTTGCCISRNFQKCPAASRLEALTANPQTLSKSPQK